MFFLFPRNIVNLQPSVCPRSIWAIDYDYYLLPVCYLAMNILSILLLLEICQSKEEKHKRNKNIKFIEKNKNKKKREICCV